MSNYTPGTWRYFRNVDETFSVIPADALTDESYAETVIAEVFTDGIADLEANARLIASAPVFYKAVVQLNRALKATRLTFSKMGLNPDELKAIIENADKLIASVNGN